MLYMFKKCKIERKQLNFVFINMQAISKISCCTIIIIKSVAIASLQLPKLIT